MESAQPLDQHQGTPPSGRLVALRRWRCARGLNQAQLAAQARLTQAAISELERGRRVPSLRTAEKLAGALGVTLAALASADPQKTWPREAVDRIASYILRGEGPVRPMERRVADDVAGLVIQKLRAHWVPGRRRVARRRWDVASRALWVRGGYGGRLPEQVLRRLDVLLAMRQVG